MSKLEGLKAQAEELEKQTEKQKPVRLTYPKIVITRKFTDKIISHIGELSVQTYMQNKRICFFGDANKVMEYNLEDHTWTKQILPGNTEFLYYAAAVTLPNGDALIIGGGSSTTVLSYS